MAIDLHAIAQTPPLIDLGEGRRAWHVQGETSLHLQAWLLEAPGFYPEGMFRHYMLSAISLRDEPGVEPAGLWEPDAVGQLTIYGVRFENARAQLMQPQEVIVQWAGLTDAQARQLADVCFVAALTNRPPPITDVRRGWYGALRTWLEEHGGRLILHQSERREPIESVRFG